MVKALCELNDPKLKFGPYTQQQVDAGNIGIPDCGEIYGYTFRPERFTGDEDKVMGTSIWFPAYKDESGKTVFGAEFPWFDSMILAIKFLQDNHFYGHVVRYALDEKCFQNPPIMERVQVTGGPDPIFSVQEHKPWITAGIVAVVNHPTDGVHISIGNVRSGITYIPRPAWFVANTDKPAEYWGKI